MDVGRRDYDEHKAEDSEYRTTLLNCGWPIPYCLWILDLIRRNTSLGVHSVAHVARGMSCVARS